MRFARAQGADLRSAVLDHADVHGCDLTGAKLAGASLNHVDLDSVIGIRVRATPA
ncbi:MAG TPA: pentapeptide repeat-containing protein [Phenylobacterium sp.]